MNTQINLSWRARDSPSSLLQKHHQLKAQTFELFKNNVLEASSTETQHVNMLSSKKKLAVKHPINDTLPPLCPLSGFVLKQFDEHPWSRC